MNTSTMVLINRPDVPYRCYWTLPCGSRSFVDHGGLALICRVGRAPQRGPQTSRKLVTALARGVGFGDGRYLLSGWQRQQRAHVPQAHHGVVSMGEGAGVPGMLLFPQVSLPSTNANDTPPCSQQHTSESREVESNSAENTRAASRFHGRVPRGLRLLASRSASGVLYNAHTLFRSGCIPFAFLLFKTWRAHFSICLNRTVF